ncbi:hypothetical protein BK809_0005767 [Diplodia seriata]|uniref:Rhodopsin domain-containing protein n=1 Tax=Diplodia seriata TaxID=420778 RepID=A0A1S8BNJ4_9PEZI|nr:hypothetical protein BK809_0005767 [Diplodia seriata]
MDATTMTPEQQAAFLAQNRQGEVYAVHISFFLLMLMVIPARIASARMAKKPLSWDDWLAFVAAVSSIRTTEIEHADTASRHSAAVMQDDPKDVSRFFQTILANEIMYTTALACARLSLVAFFYRIFGVSSMRYFLHGFVFVIISWAIATVRVLSLKMCFTLLIAFRQYVPSIRTCWPIASFWDGTNQNCIDIFKFYVGVAIGGIVTDFGLMVLPIPYIWRLNVPRYQKVLVVCTLVFGGFACFVTIIRLVKITQLDLSDPTWGTVDLMIWTGLEVYCAVICCCLPTLRPLVKVAGRCFGITTWSSTPADSHSNGLWTGSRGPAIQLNTPASHSAEEILGIRDLELAKYDNADSIRS